MERKNFSKKKLFKFEWVMMALMVITVVVTVMLMLHHRHVMRELDRQLAIDLWKLRQEYKAKFPDNGNESDYYKYYELK